MRRALAISAALAVLCLAPASSADAAATVTSAAIWHPPPGFFADFHARCDGRSGVAFADWFAAAMAAAGASRAALDFTLGLGNEGYLQALDPTGGPIAVAHAYYPFRANENSAWLLVNGEPAVIDVDDQHFLALSVLRAAPAYRAILRRYPNAMVWPGARGLAGPEVLSNGRAIVVGYDVRDVCHACAIVGRVRFVFEFGPGGKFLGARLASVAPGDK